MGIISLLCSAWPSDNLWANIIKLFDVGSKSNFTLPKTK